MKLSIVIPSYNEEKRIKTTLESIKGYVNDKKLNAEIIVVDDGSKDNTRKICEKKNVKLNNKRKNKGKGYSVKEGMLLAKGDYILFSDADLSTPIEELDKFLNYIDRYDVVIGSRALKKSRIFVKQPLYRVLMGKFFNLLVRLFVVRGIKDTQCGFKLFSKRAAKEIFIRQKLNGFGFDVEILFITQKKGFKIKEVPVVWKNAEGTKVNPIKDSLKMFFDILKIRYNSLLGLYK